MTRSESAFSDGHESKAPYGTPRARLAPLLRLDLVLLALLLLLLLLPAHPIEDLRFFIGSQLFLQPARSISLESRPNSLKIQNETTRGIVRWTRVV